MTSASAAAFASSALTSGVAASAWASVAGAAAGLLLPKKDLLAGATEARLVVDGARRGMDEAADRLEKVRGLDDRATVRRRDRDSMAEVEGGDEAREELLGREGKEGP